MKKKLSGKTPEGQGTSKQGNWPETKYSPSVEGCQDNPLLSKYSSQINKNLQPWEVVVTDVIGSIIEFWGFKRNHGRVWALLYVNEKPFSATEIQEKLELSKGAVSMIVRELERWKVVHRVRVSHSSAWHFVAETNLTAMIARVLSERENNLVALVKHKLQQAQALLQEQAHPSPEIVARISRLTKLVELMEQAITLFLNTAPEDISELFEVFQEEDLYDNTEDDQ